MALDYFLSIATRLEPRQALQIINDELHLKWVEGTHLLGPGVVLSAIYESALSKSIIEEDFAFRPTVSIGFRLLPNSDEYEEGKHVLLRATMILLNHEEGDAVLLFNGDKVLLQRLKGQLIANKDWFRYSDDPQLSELKPPYELRSLSLPLN